MHNCQHSAGGDGKEHAAPQLFVVPKVKMRNYILKSIAVISGVIGLYLLFKDFFGYYYSILAILSGKMPFGTTCLFLIFSVIIALRLVSSYGLYKLTNWGRNFSIGVLSFDFLWRLTGFINMWTYYIRYPEKRAIAEKLLEQLKQTEANGAIVGKVSMIPSYVIAFISLVSVILLLKFKIEHLRATTCASTWSAKGG